MQLSRILSVGLVAALGTATIALLPLAARAQTQALDFTGGIQATTGGDITAGWKFSLSNPVLLTDLGVFDADNDGFVNAHQVGLWTDAGTLLSSTTLTAGLSGTPVVSTSGFGAFRYNSVSTIVLTPGTYIIGASYRNLEVDSLGLLTNAPLMATGFSFVDGAISDVFSGFVVPTLSLGDNGYFGPNLRFSLAPEPGTVALLAVGILGGVVARRRRR